MKLQLALAIFCATALLVQSSETKPNILFIAVDDLRCDLGCYGNSQVHSPNIDRLAASGVVFTRAYCQQAVCNPSRASLMTGLRPDSTQVWDLKTDFRTKIPNAVTLPQFLRKNGYRAEGYGKIFHNEFPDDVSWDKPHRWPDKGIEWSEASLNRLEKYRLEMKAAGKSDAEIKHMRAPATEVLDIADGDHADGAIADQAINALRELAKSKQPFFMGAGFCATHLPFTPPKKYWDLYDPAKITLASNGFIPHGAPSLAFGEKSLGGFYELRGYMDFASAPTPFERTLDEAQQRNLKHAYFAATSFADSHVGRLLDELDRLGIAENTVVVFWSDHGWKLGEHAGWCKQTNYEIDTRAPLIIRVPGAKNMGNKTAALAEFLDIYPTVCELVGLSAPKELEGKSLVPLLAGTAGKVKDAAFSQFIRNEARGDFMGYAMRTDRYRYIEWINLANGSIEAQELYDHLSDPDENENIANREENADSLKNLSTQMWAQLPIPKLRP